TSCAAGNRLCIENGRGKWSQARLVIVDAGTGESLRTVDWLNTEFVEWTLTGRQCHAPPWSISADGTTLAYCEHVGADVRAICLDVDSGRVLHKFDPLDNPDPGFLLSQRPLGRSAAENVVVSADGKYLAIQKQYDLPEIIDLERQRPIMVSWPSPPAQNSLLLARMIAAAPQEKPKSFSRDGRFLIESDGKVRDILDDKIRWDAKAPCLFVQ